MEDRYLQDRQVTAVSEAVQSMQRVTTKKLAIGKCLGVQTQQIVGFRLLVWPGKPGQMDS
jgi:hypothetical protein